jgi:hypothetical protein
MRLFLIASSRILLTKRTIGASSTSSRPWVSAPASSSPPVTSRFSRSMSSSERLGMAASACSMALSTAICSLSSSTTTNSMLIDVWKRISSSACRLVGSATARNSRLPRFISGSTRCFCISFSLTRRTASRSGGTASRSNRGTPNSLEAEMAMSRAVARFEATMWVTRLMRFSLARTMASCMPASSTRPSCTRRCASPPRATRPVPPSDAKALSFMDLR